jgi:DNA-binding NtrC family response regulator
MIDMDREVFQQQFGLLGSSDALRQVVDKIMQVAKTDITVLLQGESGVGKDVTARAIHGMSLRKQNELIIVNCGAIPEGIIESELFGHEKGAFTGANDTRQGYFEKADGGTIFLDEIGDTPKNVQVKLLRILENGEFFRVGSSKLQTADVRIIAATNKDLWELVKEGSFREDLYYRLDTVQIHLPALRDRSEDIIPIFRNFVEHYSRKYDSVFRGFSDEAKALLSSYRWPGNIRELRNIAEQLVVLEKSQFVDVDTLRKYLKGRQSIGSADNLPMLQGSIDNTDNRNQQSGQQGSELIYRALLEMSNDIGDLKKMLANLVYSLFSSKNNPQLPALLGVGGNTSSLDHVNATTQSGQANPIDYSNPGHIKLDHTQGQDAMSYTPRHLKSEVKGEEFEPYDEPIQEEVDDFMLQLKGKEIPSLEETEKFLIQKALEIFDGNRRKASETLGISERTLYRKLDQFGLEKK